MHPVVINQWRERLHGLGVSCFMVLEFPYSCASARVVNYFMIVTILLNAVVNIITAEPVGQYIPDTCPSHPVCIPGTPGAFCTKIICEPLPKPLLQAIHRFTVIIVTGDYFIRLMTVHTVQLR